MIAAGHALEFRPLAARPEPLAAPLPALHGEVGALLAPTRLADLGRAAPSRCGGGRPTKRRCTPPSNWRAQDTRSRCSPKAPGEPRACGRRGSRMPTRAPRASRSKPACRSIPAGIAGTDGLRRLAQLKVSLWPARSRSTTSATTREAARLATDRADGRDRRARGFAMTEVVAARCRRRLARPPGLPRRSRKRCAESAAGPSMRSSASRTSS